MVEGQAQAHHRTDRDPPIDDGGLLHDSAHAQNGYLGRVDNGREGVYIVVCQGRYRETRAGHIVQGQLALSTPVGQLSAPFLSYSSSCSKGGVMMAEIGFVLITALIIWLTMKKS